MTSINTWGKEIKGIENYSDNLLPKSSSFLYFLELAPLGVQRQRALINIRDVRWLIHHHRYQQTIQWWSKQEVNLSEDQIRHNWWNPEDEQLKKTRNEVNWVVHIIWHIRTKEEKRWSLSKEKKILKEKVDPGEKK